MKRSRQGRRVRRERRERRAESVAKMLARKSSGKPKLGAGAKEITLDARCPVCGGVVVGKGDGRWRCARSRKEFRARRFLPGQSRPERVKDSAVRYLRCGASGTIMQDGSLAVLVSGARWKEEE